MQDRVSGLHQGFGFVEFKGEEDADYVRAPKRESTALFLAEVSNAACRITVVVECVKMSGADPR